MVDQKSVLVTSCLRQRIAVRHTSTVVQGGHYSWRYKQVDDPSMLSPRACISLTVRPVGAQRERSRRTTVAK